jgi:ABC-2 type transport system ATP-binding protein
MLLEIRDVTKTFRGGVRANDGISLSVEAGEVFGLLGPNGAGKTTLVGQVLGAVVPTSGSIEIDGVDVVRRPAFARQACSYQPQTSVPIDGLTPLEAVEIAGRLRGGPRDEVRERGRRLLSALGLDEWAGRTVPLSGGVARLVAFCMAAVVPGRIVILDEPTNDVDPLRRKLLWEQVRALADEGSAVLLVTHNVLEAERCVNRLAIVGAGRLLAAGTPATLKADGGERLRLELVLEPAAVQPIPPPFLDDPVLTGRRLIGEFDAGALPDAIDWASHLRDSGVVEEFSVGPITMEDVYVRRVTRMHEEAEVGAA